MTKVNPNNGNVTISDIFPLDILKSDVIYIFYQKVLKYFNGFHGWHLSITFQK